MAENLEMPGQDRERRQDAILFDGDEDILVSPARFELGLLPEPISGRPTFGKPPAVEHGGDLHSFPGYERPDLHRRMSILAPRSSPRHHRQKTEG